MRLDVKFTIGKNERYYGNGETSKVWINGKTTRDLLNDELRILENIEDEIRNTKQNNWYKNINDVIYINKMYQRLDEYICTKNQHVSVDIHELDVLLKIFKKLFDYKNNVNTLKIKLKDIYKILEELEKSMNTIKESTEIINVVLTIDQLTKFIYNSYDYNYNEESEVLIDISN